MTRNRPRPASTRPASGTGDACDAGELAHGVLAAEMRRLTTLLLGRGDVDEVGRHVVAAAATVLPSAVAVSLTVLDPDGTARTPLRTDPVATELDAAQYRVGEGPCLDAARDGGPAYTTSGDLRAEIRWPRWRREVADHAMRAVLSTALVPDPAAPRTLGALNVYAREPGVFTPADADRALLLATHASLALARARSEENLQRALASRDVIGQAKGILMARRGHSADEAFDVLRRTSQDLNVKLHDLAGTLARNHRALDDRGP